MSTTLDLSALSPTARREVRDFYLFLLSRPRSAKKKPAKHLNLQRFTDLCGGLSWQGDAVSAQRSLRNEW